MANTFNFGNGNWAQKTEKVLAYNAENNNYKPLPFDFDRGSTATRVNKQGLIETVGVDEPRIDFLNNTKGHLLLEPERTNSLLQSNQFDTTWTTSNATVTSGHTGVGGSTDAWLLNSSAGYLIQVVSLSGASTMSVYAKKGTAQGIRVRIDATTDANCYIDLSNGNEIASNTGTNLDVTNVGNDWYRISLSIDSAISNVRFYAIDNTATSTSGTVYIQYAQLEAGSYATSHIPTQGSAVTRSAEDIVLTLPDNASFNSSVGFTLYGEFLTNGGSGTSVMALQFNGNTGFFGFGSNSVNWRARVNNGTVNELHNSQASILSVGKLALSFNSSGFSMYANGASFASGNTDMSAITSSDSVEYRDNTEEFGSFQIRELKLYNTRLSDNELQTLTS